MSNSLFGNEWFCWRSGLQLVNPAAAAPILLLSLLLLPPATFARTHHVRRSHDSFPTRPLAASDEESTVTHSSSLSHQLLPAAERKIKDDRSGQEENVDQPQEQLLVALLLRERQLLLQLLETEAGLAEYRGDHLALGLTDR